MHSALNKFLPYACNTLKTTPGSLEVVKTMGTKVLYEEDGHWIDYGVSNIEEIYTDVKEIIDMIIGYSEYGDDVKQFMYDVMAVLDDLSFHASIFGIYYLSLEAIFEKNTDRSHFERHNDIIRLDSHYRENVHDIAAHWDSHLAPEERVDWLNRMITFCFQIKRYFEILFEDEAIFDRSEGYPGFQELHWRILSLQCLWKEAKRKSKGRQP